MAGIGGVPEFDQRGTPYIRLRQDTSTAVLSHTIVAGNSRVSDGNPPVADDLAGNGTYELEYSLIGNNAGTELTEAPLGSPDPNGNLIGGPIHGIINPLIGPLSDNGGPTQTHALLPGSPAIDAMADSIAIPTQ